MRRVILGLPLVGLAVVASCASDDAGGSAGPSTGGTSATGGTGGSTDAGKDSPSDTSSESSGPSCTNGSKDGTETDVDCGGSCDPCDDGKGCGKDGDCESGVCQTTCQTATCSDGVKNGGETGVDCGGPCPATYHGFGCVDGTNGSKVCSSFPNDGGVPALDDAGMEMFDVAISWNATGGNGFVNYVLIYGSTGITYNSQGIAGGSANNICTSGPVTESFQLPLGDAYTYKIWLADCINPNACSGCGYDSVIAEGGPFGIAKDLCN